MKKRNSNPLKHIRIRFSRNCSLWAECSWKSKRLSQSFLLIMGWRSYLYNVWIVVVKGLRKFTRFCNIVGIVWNTLVSEVLQTHKAEKKIPHLLALEIFGIFFFHPMWISCEEEGVSERLQLFIKIREENIFLSQKTFALLFSVRQINSRKGFCGFVCTVKTYF